MNTWLDTYNILKELDLDEVVNAAVAETKSEIRDLNIEQMYAGKLSDGSDIEPEYADSTKRRKKAKGQPFDRVTLRDKKNFHDQYTIEVEGDKIKMNSDVEYEKYLTKRYSKKIWNLNEDNRQKYVDGSLMKVIQKSIEEKTLLKFE